LRVVPFIEQFELKDKPNYTVEFLPTSCMWSTQQAGPKQGRI